MDSQRPITGSLRSLIYLLVVLSTFLLFPPMSTGASVEELRKAKITESLEDITGLSEEEVQQYQKKVEQMSYTGRRIFRALSRLPDASRDHMEALIQLTAKPSIRFSHIPLLEQYCSLDDASLTGTYQLIDSLDTASFVSEQVLTELADVKELSAADVPLLIDKIKLLQEPGQWATQSLLAFPDIDASTVSTALDMLADMTDPQCRAAEKALLMKGLKKTELIPLLYRLKLLNTRDTVNVRSLVQQPSFSASDLAFWFDNFFMRTDQTRDSLFNHLSNTQKNLLLFTYQDAATDFIWQINNLHAVTNKYGQEISSSQLLSFDTKTLKELFGRLHQRSAAHFRTRYISALERGMKQEALALLRAATAHARKQTALDLSSANIYILLANGGELYDSSFRDILAPVLKKRIVTSHNDRLLDFLLTTDPSHIFVSDFITNLAQKGRLTLFFPEDSDHQKKILELVTESALRNDDSLILFSATFSRLLEALQPMSRSYLIDLLLAESATRGKFMADRLQVIMQYYVDNFPKLLSSVDKEKILNLVQQRGPIDIAPYIRTPFRNWREDGQLNGLSVFQADDDGSSSYASFSFSLFEAGYRPSVSKSYTPYSLSDDAHKKVQSAFKRLPAAPSATVYDIYHLAKRFSLAIDWQKQVNNLQITQTLYIYQDKKDQERLLRTFLLSGDEMFAQRGHSYWRHEQLFEPLENLAKEGREVNAALHSGLHFISLGSCGGMRAYSRINRLFNNKVAILATIGTGKAAVNNPYNRKLFEQIARKPELSTWKELETHFKNVFEDSVAGDYIQPGSLPAILHRMMADEIRQYGTDQQE